LRPRGERPCGCRATECEYRQPVKTSVQRY
jgi:hypothetical protein